MSAGLNYSFFSAKSSIIHVRTQLMNVQSTKRIWLCIQNMKI